MYYYGLFACHKARYPMTSFESLLTDVRDCSICASHLPHGARPILQISKRDHHAKKRLSITTSKLRQLSMV